MDINIPEGVSELTYPDTSSTSLIPYNEHIKAVAKLEESGMFKIYIPGNPFNEFTTLDANCQYKFETSSSFTIHTS